MSIFQFLAAQDGWISANVAEDDNALSEKEKDELWDWINADY